MPKVMVSRLTFNTVAGAGSLLRYDKNAVNERKIAMNTMHKLAILRRLAAGALLAASVSVPASAETPEQFLQYLTQHRPDTALASFTVRPDGAPDPADPVLFLNADEPLPLASTFKIVVLAAYARETTAGRLDRQQRISVGDWERYYLPATDGGTHSEALSYLRIPTDDHGFALDPGTTVSLDDVAFVMIRFSDNAAADFLMAQLGNGPLQAVIDEAGLTGQELPQPILGTFLSWANHENGSLTKARLQKLLSLGSAGYAAEVQRLTAEFQDPDWHAAEVLWRENGGDHFSYALTAQAGASLFTRGTARDYARIMSGVITGTFLSPEISAVMRRNLDIPLDDHSTLLSLGFKGGDIPGVITGASYFVPATGSFAAKPHVSVLFQRGLAQNVWNGLLESFDQFSFAIDLGLDRSFALLVNRKLIRGR